MMYFHILAKELFSEIYGFNVQILCTFRNNFWLKDFKTSKHFEIFRILLEHMNIIFRELQVFS